MKLLKKQRGLPFLLALGVLFILSASFLAVQLWSEKTFRGALFALEAPVMPPAMPKVIAPPAVKKVAKKPAIVVEAAAQPIEAPAVDESENAPEVQAEPVPAPELKEVSSINKAEVKSEPVEKPAVVIEKPVKPLVVEEKVASSVVKSEPKVEKKTPIASKQSVQNESSVVKPRKTRKKAKVEEIPTEVPAEWNWFSKPLKVDLAKGKAVIERDEAGQEIRLSANEKIKGIEVVTEKGEAAVEVSSDVSAALVEETDVSVAQAEPATGKPFMVALARMARIKQMRHAAEESRKVSVKSSESISPSMRRLAEVIKVLCDKLDSRPVPQKVLEKNIVADEAQTSAVTGVSEMSSDAEASSTAKVSDNASFKPYYGGSGSSFSQRINSLLKSGMIRAE